jgi:MinD-like ATPase involved in chromosome partitioning or flagellar assembly
VIPEVAIAVSPRDWAERLHRFIADHGGARVRARVLDGREALDETYAVLVVDDLTSFLTARLVGELHHRGRRILGIYDPVEPAGADRLEALGVDDVAAANEDDERLVRRIDALALAAGADLDRELTALASEPARRDDGTATDDAGPSVRRGVVVAVSAPPGGAGATEVAIELAHALVDGGVRTCLVDVDEVAPSVAPRLGLGLHPNIRTAVDLVQHRSGSLVGALQAVADGPAVVAGAPTGRDAVDLRPGEVVDVLDELAERFQVVLVDIGHRFEELGGLGRVGRYGRARAVLDRADLVVGVAAASPTGVTRFLDWLADARACASAPVHVVVNRLHGGAFHTGELEHEIRRTYSPPSLHVVPEDRRVAAAAWDGVRVARGPFRKAVAGLARDVVRVPVTSA